MENISQKIYPAALKFLTPATISQTYSLLVAEAMKLTKADSGSILLKKKGELKRVYSTSKDLYQIKPNKQGQMNMAFARKKPMIFSSEEIAKTNPEIKKIPAKSHLITPLYYRDTSLGVLNLNSLKDNYFTSEHLDILEMFSPLATLAILKAQADQRAEKALETRDLFISTAAHELRTPLTTINGYIELLHSQFSGANTPTARWLAELSRESHRVIKMVKELLQLEAARSGKLPYFWDECNLVKIVNIAIKNITLTHPGYKIIFQNKLKNHSDKVKGDFDKLMQVVTNILNNAVKYSSQAAPIAAVLQFKEPNLIILTIQDLGMGIAREDLPHIFERYYRGSNVKKDGFGLGLFLAKDIIKKHHGKICIQSEVGKGTIVEIKLPTVGS